MIKHFGTNMDTSGIVFRFGGSSLGGSVANAVV